MALSPPPKLWGLHTITTGTNDMIHWQEDDGTNTYNLSITCSLTGGQYLEDILIDITTAMSTESDANGLGNDHAGQGGIYGYSYSDTTGVVSLTGTHPTAGGFQWFPKTNTGTRKILTDGDLAAGAQGNDHLGWVVAAADPSLGLIFASDGQHGRSWYPDQPPQADDDHPSSTVVETVTAGGKTKARDFSGNVSDLVVRRLRFDLLDQDSKDTLEDFWTTYLKTGNRFYYYPDRTDNATFTESVLTEDRLRDLPWERVYGYSWYRIGMAIRNYVA